MEHVRAKDRDARQVAMTVSLLASFLMLGGKFAAYLLTGSAAIFSDAAESIVHLLATGFVALGLWYTFQPPDTQHPYGHGKVAYFASGFEGGMISVAALSILYVSVKALVEGPAVEQLGTGLLLVALLCAANLALGLYLVRTGRRTNSLVLVSNGRHVLTDMWTSLGVLVGVGLVGVTGAVWLDPAVAILVALNILWTASKLIRQSVEGLMEKAETTDTEAILAELERATEERRILGYHQLRHRRVNDERWIEYHLLFPQRMTITEAHARAHAVEEGVSALFPADRVYVTAHLEPNAPHEEAHPEGHREPVDPLGEIEGWHVAGRDVEDNPNPCP